MKTKASSSDKQSIEALKQEYIAHRAILVKSIDRLISKQSPTKATIDAISQAQRLLKELDRHLPLTPQSTLDKVPKKELLGIKLTDDDLDLLVKLTSICSRTSHGLCFIYSDGAPFKCNMYVSYRESLPEVQQGMYDAEAHKNNMHFLAQTASNFKGAGWVRLKQTLLILSAVMLVAVGIVSAIPTGGLSLPIALSAAALVTAGAGFFVGHETGLAGAIRALKMESDNPTPKDDSALKGNSK